MADERKSAETSDKVASIAGRFMSMDATELLHAVAENAQAVLEEIQSVSASALRQHEQ